MTDLEKNLSFILTEKENKIIPENIKSGINIFGVEGIVEQGVDTSDATATANDLVQNKTAYVNGEKIRGTIMDVNILQASNTPSISEQSSGNLVFAGTTSNTQPVKIDSGDTLKVVVPPADVANYIGLTPEKLVAGNNILGVEGAAELGGNSDYNAKVDIDIIKEEGTSQFDLRTIIKTLPQLNTINQSNLNGLFYNCDKLESIPHIDTSSATNLDYLFHKCSSIKEIPNLDYTNTTDIDYMCNYCTSLTNVPDMNLPEVINMSYLFYNCTSLIKSPNIYAPKAKYTYNVFEGCTSLTTLGDLQFSEAAYNYMGFFRNCSLLTDIPELVADGVVNVSNMCAGCTSLTNFGGLKNIGKAYTTTKANYSNCTLNFSDCVLLTHESLMNIINKLYDLNLTYNTAGGGTLYTQSLILGETNLAKLTANEIAVATNKGWTVS